MNCCCWWYFFFSATTYSTTQKRSSKWNSPFAYLLSLGALPARPLHAGPPILDHIGFCVLLTLSSAKPSLRADGRYHMWLQEVDLQILLQRPGHHMLGTPRASVYVHFQSVQEGVAKERKRKQLFTISWQLSWHVGNWLQLLILLLPLARRRRLPLAVRVNLQDGVGK